MVIGEEETIEESLAKVLCVNGIGEIIVNTIRLIHLKDTMILLIH
jgi:hypothetical protein